MSKLEAQARKILTSLVAKPALLYTVLNIIGDEYDIAGPWAEVEDANGQNYYERRDPLSRESVAMVARVPTDSMKWQWQVRGGQSGDTIAGAHAAQLLADAELRNIGYLVA
jgi:hypothetical protein